MSSARQPLTITKFKGKYFYLSNFYRCTVIYNGFVWRSAEHAYQGEKVRHYGEAAMRIVQAAEGAAEAKALAHSYVCPPDWDEHKVQIMLDILRRKFVRLHNSGRRNILSDWLLASGDAELIEGNNWGDTFWGQCPLGTGENMLGKLLMKVRSELRAL